MECASLWSYLTCRSLRTLTYSRFLRTTVRPWCHLFLRQQTWQEKLNFVVVDGLRMWESRSDFQAWRSSRRHLQAGQMVSIGY